MPSDYELNIARYRTFLREVLEPAVYPLAQTLKAAVWQVIDPRATPPAAAEAARVLKSGDGFTPVDIGYVWGPRWSTAWFAVSGTVPEAFEGRKTVVRFSSGTEAQLWTHHEATSRWVPERGLDVNRDSVPLHDVTPAHANITLLIEAACNHPFGVLGFEWDPPEVHHRWNSASPGRLERCEIAVLDDAVLELRRVYAFALGLLVELPATGNRACDLFRVLRDATARVISLPQAPHADSAIRRPMLHLEVESVIDATASLTECLNRSPSGSTTNCFAVGHAHIDTAWLWPIRETRRKCLRSFSNQLRLMEVFPDYRFLCSQAQQYAWVKEDSPELFAAITSRVAEGRWEAHGAMWVEPDCNCPSGESLVRQIVYGEQFWREHFGEAAPQRMLFLPDTFGFPATLPQIMAQAGLDTFVTNKLTWSTSNIFPHTSFVWKGLDGSRVLAHNTPGQDYNAVNTPKELARGEANHRTKSAAPALWLQPFGYGDGGGGATENSIRFAQLAGACDGMPAVKLARADAFCEALHAQHEQYLSASAPLFAEWSGELYLEVHRGTLTTQAWIKEANRRAEEDLRLAEILLSGGHTPSPDAATALGKLEKAWKLLLLNQFHDILPGSSIGWVYEDSRRDYARIAKITSAIHERETTNWLAGLSTRGVTKPVGVFNPCSVARSGVIQLADGKLIFARGVPALGVAVIDASVPHGQVPVSLEQDEVSGDITLSNGLISAVIDQKGEITSLRRGGVDVSVAEQDRTSDLNTLELYEDVPHMWDAWDIDAQYEDKPRDATYNITSIEVASDDPLRCAVKFSRKLGALSSIEQTYTLDAGSPRLDVHNRVDWHEHRTFLRARFPTRINSERASYEIQFGVVERPTHRNTTWDAAKFEVCAHRWMDLAQPGLGLAILNDSKYGHSCHGGELGLSLLRAPKHPDPNADIGLHEFTYSMMPHGGDWRAAGVDREAEALNTPMLAYVLNSGEDGVLGGRYSPITIHAAGSAQVAVAALKVSEDGTGLILRLWECHGGVGEVVVRWNAPHAGQAGEPGTHHAALTPRLTLVNLLEQPLPLESQKEACVGQITLTLRGWQLISIKIALT